jgi:hypothetical protein
MSAADLDEASVEMATGGITLNGSIGVAVPPWVASLGANRPMSSSSPGRAGVIRCRVRSGELPGATRRQGCDSVSPTSQVGARWGDIRRTSRRGRGRLSRTGRTRCGVTGSSAQVSQRAKHRPCAGDRAAVVVGVAVQQPVAQCGSNDADTRGRRRTRLRPHMGNRHTAGRQRTSRRYVGVKGAQIHILSAGRAGQRRSRPTGWHRLRLSVQQRRQR